MFSLNIKDKKTFLVIYRFILIILLAVPTESVSQCLTQTTGDAVINAGECVLNDGTMGTSTLTSSVGQSVPVFINNTQQSQINLIEINSGTIINSTAQNISGIIMNYGSIFNISNGGNINTEAVIYNANFISNISNYGLINGKFFAIGNEFNAIIEVINNYGTISTPNPGSYSPYAADIDNINFGIINNSTIRTINNAGIISSYAGKLPENYNIIIQSPSNYGRFTYFPQSFWTSLSGMGVMSFGVHPASSVQARTYSNVLEGVPSSAITPSTMNGIFGRYSWVLSDVDSDTNWDLTFASLGPDPGNTLSALQSSSSAVRSLLSVRAATTTFALDYDCSVFDKHGFCITVGTRNSQLRSNYADSGETAGLLTAAYRLTPQLRLGGFIDHNLATNSPVGVDPKNIQPMVGLFGVYQERQNFAGLTVRAALAYQQDELRITRPELENTEPGMGWASAHAFAFGGEIAYGVPFDNAWVAQPYVGLRRSDSRRKGYTENTSDNVKFPITYNRFGQTVTTATTGLRVRGAITAEFSVTLGAGLEHDLDSRVDRYAGTSAIPDLERFSINASQQQNETRAVVAAGVRYVFASNQALAFDASVRQLPYGNDPSITTILRYSMGF